MSRTATPADVLAGRARSCVVEGDATEVVRALPLACIDALVTDPPAGIAFMGAEWDGAKGGRAQWVAWLAEVLGHARAATRDGGRALVWSLPRTSHWTGCAVEDAGWSIETTVQHLFGTGWPKGKSQLKPLAETWWLARTGRSTALNIEACRVRSGASPSVDRREAAARRGVGPAGERPSGIVDRSSLDAYTAERGGESAGRYPPNVVLSHAPGCRCAGERRVRAITGGTKPIAADKARICGEHTEHPFFNHADPDGTECVEGCPVAELDRQSGELVSGAVTRPVERGLGYGGGNGSALPLRDVDRGGASRFFPCFPADEYALASVDEGALFGYHAKPSRAERDAGVSLDASASRRFARKRRASCGKQEVNMPGSACVCPSPQWVPAEVVDPQRNNHPTVKSISLMRWLIRLVTQPGDVVLDPFGGSGTTGAAALAEGRRVILVERDPRFAEIARQRLEHVTPDMGRPVRVAPSARAAEPGAVSRQLGLFDAAGAP